MADLSEIDSPLSAGDEIDGKYQIITLIGYGGMGYVYEAEDRSLGRRVALKILPAMARVDGGWRARFAREARATARVRHPGVVEIYETGCDGEVDYIAMELLEGESVDARLKRTGPFAIEAVQRLAEALADALAAIHRAGIIHRDLKPRNLFLAIEGSQRDVLKVLDFGVAKSGDSFGDATTITDQIIGTPRYMAPEQLRSAKDVGFASDLWAVGAIVYELLSGRPPYRASSAAELLLRIMMEDPPPLTQFRADVPPALTYAVSLSLRRDPRARLASADSLLSLLRCSDVSSVHELAAAGHALDSLDPFGATTAGGRTPPRTRAHRRWRVSAVLLIIGALMPAAHPLEPSPVRAPPKRARPAAGAPALSGRAQVVAATPAPAHAGSAPTAAVLPEPAHATSRRRERRPATPAAREPEAEREPEATHEHEYHTAGVQPELTARRSRARAPSGASRAQRPAEPTRAPDAGLVPNQAPGHGLHDLPLRRGEF